MSIGSTTGYPSPFAKPSPDSVRTGEGGAASPAAAVAGAKALPLPEAAAARVLPARALSSDTMAQLVNVGQAPALPGPPKAASTPQQMLEQMIQRVRTQLPGGAESASGTAPAAQPDESLRTTIGGNRPPGGDGASGDVDGGKPAPDQPAPNPASLPFGQLPSRRENLGSAVGLAPERAKTVAHAIAAEKEPLRLAAYPLAVAAGNWPIKAGSIVLAGIAFLGFLYFH